jgi:pimeloyl-ACP methyl ester carboxylesterase
VIDLGGKVEPQSSSRRRASPTAENPVWANAVINIPEEFKNDFRVITMDQRNATGGESTGPVSVDDPWGAFADDQLGLMDHLGIRQFFFFGNCIGARSR